MKRTKDLTNQVFGSLTAMRYSHSDRSGTAHWVYLCVCGKEHTARANTITHQAKKRGILSSPPVAASSYSEKPDMGFARLPILTRPIVLIVA